MDEEKILLPRKFEGMSIFCPPLCHELTGREFTLIMDDGYDRKIAFPERGTILCAKAEEEPRTYACDVLKADRDTYFVNFEVPGLSPRTGITLILDLEQSLVTMATAHLGQDPKYPCMPAIEFLFGAIRREDGSAPTIRHGYTPDLVGRAIAWNYGTFDVVHVYSSERYYRVAFTPERIQRMVERMKAEGREMPKGDAPRGVYEDYAAYIKIKDGLYVVSLLETLLCRMRGHGNSLLFLMNLKEMHDVGRSFGTNDKGEGENYVFGAFGRDFDARDTLERKSTYHIR